VHRPYSNCISSVENLTGTPLSSITNGHLLFVMGALILKEFKNVKLDK